ncbi:interleukin-17 receptor E isoform X1 [Oryzias latipes]|uniref:SEFIR domain-containing protein n=1 Tax=Oryzias latipes TaxID=8090 RepID=A0A3B3IAP7_ORYLA|nr:interleukin-17 receptor E isoform X1 [Oryzias latipes]
MNKGRFFSVWILFIVFYPQFIKSKCDVSCRAVRQNDIERGECPVRLTSEGFNNSDGYFENITFRVWMTVKELCECPKIEIHGRCARLIRPILKKERGDSEWPSGRLRCENYGRTDRKCRCNKKLLQKGNFSLWELEYNCSKAEAGSNVSLSYITNSSNCSVTYQVSDPRPNFSVNVNESSRTIAVAVDSAEKVNSRLCYKLNSLYCVHGSGLPLNPQIVSKSVVFNISFLLPCLCVEAYYTYGDARRRKICPFENESLLDAGDILRTSEVILYTSEIKWSFECPANGLNLSASLCWKLQEHFCIPVPNSVLKKTDEVHLMFSTSGVDIHPQMCVKFSLQDKHNISCLYQNEIPGWEADVGPGRQSMVVHLTSSAPGNFSAQLCVLTEVGCTPVGSVHSVAMKNVSKKSIEVPVYLIDEKPCVQVWKSDLIGRRILCLDYTRNRSGTFAATAFMSAVVLLLLGLVIRRVIKSVTEDWLVIQRPLLLVCSSDQSMHVSAVCALASILHGKLGATVHTALWAQSSQKPSESRAGVADLGPVPWLYGQWEAVCKAQGKVLIIWSPDAKKTYERWRLEMSMNGRTAGSRKANTRHEKIKAEEEELFNNDIRKVGKWKKATTAARKKDVVQLCDEEGRFSEKKPSAVMEPVFVAALASLEGTLLGCKNQQVAIVYFQGLCHSKDIPKDLRGVSRYCLPQDFSGLVQELGMERGELQWPRLLSKLLSTWLARRLARRLQTLLLQMKGQSLSSSAKTTSGQKRSRFRLQLGSVHEQELLRESPWRREEL